MLIKEIFFSVLPSIAEAVFAKLWEFRAPIWAGIKWWLIGMFLASFLVVPVLMFDFKIVKLVFDFALFTDKPEEAFKGTDWLRWNLGQLAEWALANHSAMTVYTAIRYLYWGFVASSAGGIVAVIFVYRRKGIRILTDSHAVVVEKLEEKIRRYKERFDAMFNLSQNTVFLLKPDFVIIDCNKNYDTWAEKYDLPEDPRGKGFFYVFWFLANRELRERMDKILEGGEKVSFLEKFEIQLENERESKTLELVALPIVTNQELLLYVIIKGDEND